MAEKDEYHIAASSVDVGYDLWESWRDNRMRIPHWYSVAKDMALMQPSSAFMERVFSILRACMDERQELTYSDRIAASLVSIYHPATLFVCLFLIVKTLRCCVPVVNTAH